MSFSFFFGRAVFFMLRRWADRAATTLSYPERVNSKAYLVRSSIVKSITSGVSAQYSPTL